MRLEKLIGS